MKEIRSQRTEKGTEKKNKPIENKTKEMKKEIFKPWLGLKVSPMPLSEILSFISDNSDPVYRPTCLSIRSSVCLPSHKIP